MELLKGICGVVWGLVLLVGVGAEAALSNSVSRVEIFVGFSVDENLYETEVNVECDNSVTSITGVAQFGSFSCNKDGDRWKFRDNDSVRPLVDGDWTLTFFFVDGSTSNSVFSFQQEDDSSLPIINTCPEISVPDVSGGTLVETNVVVQWDAPFDASANFAGFGYKDRTLIDDVNFEFPENGPLTTREYGPVDLTVNIEEMWLFNAFAVERTNADGIDYLVGTFANHDYEVTIVEAPPSAGPVTNHVSSIEIYAGISMDMGEYEVEVDIECSSSVTGIVGVAPFGDFVLEKDQDDEWEFASEGVSTNEPQPAIDGDWLFTFYLDDGSASSTVIPFMQADGITPLPSFTTCPEISVPDLSGSYLFETNVVVQWNASFDAAANFASIGFSNPTNDDVDYEFPEVAPLSSVEYGPVEFGAGIEEIWIYNGFVVNATNTAGLSYAIGRYANYDYEIPVVEAPEPDEPVTNHVFGVEIFAGLSMDMGEYEVEVEIECDGSVTGIVGVAPLGEFVLKQDEDNGDEWEFDLDGISTNEPQPAVDGNWLFTFYLNDGSTNSTVIPFMQADGVTPLPTFLTCPEISVPDLSEGYLFETNVVVQWDAPFDAAANFAGIGYWKPGDEEDVNVEFPEWGPLSLREYGPVDLDAGIEELWIFNGFVVNATNAVGLPYSIGRYANYDYDVLVTRGDWDVDGDHLSNAWELEHFGNLTNGVASDDSDGDGVDNLTEFYVGTNPQSGLSTYDLSVTMSNVVEGMHLSWPALQADRYAYVFGTTNLLDSFVLLATNLTDAFYIDGVHHSYDAGFYQVRVGASYAHKSFAPLMNILVDGYTEDWNGLTPLVVDPVEGNGVLSGVDITGIYFAQGASDLFVRIDRAGVDMPPQDGYARIWMQLIPVGSGKNYAIDISGGQSGFSSCSVMERVGEDEWTRLVDDLPMNADGQSVELSIPFSEVDFVGQYFVSVYATYSEMSEPSDEVVSEDIWKGGVVSVP